MQRTENPLKNNGIPKNAGFLESRNCLYFFNDFWDIFGVQIVVGFFSGEVQGFKLTVKPL